MPRPVFVSAMAGAVLSYKNPAVVFDDFANFLTGYIHIPPIFQKQLRSMKRSVSFGRRGKDVFLRKASCLNVPHQRDSAGDITLSDGKKDSIVKNEKIFSIIHNHRQRGWLFSVHVFTDF